MHMSAGSLVFTEYVCMSFSDSHLQYLEAENSQAVRDKIKKSNKIQIVMYFFIPRDDKVFLEYFLTDAFCFFLRRYKVKGICN